MAALLNKKTVVKHVSKQINIEEETNHTLVKYVEFLGMEDLKGTEAIDYVVNEALKYIFSRDKEFRKYLEDLDKNRKDDEAHGEADPDEKEETYS